MESNKSNNYFNKIMPTLKESKSFKVICVTILLLLLSIFIFNIVNKSGIIKNVSYIVSAEKVDVTINSNNSAEYVETYQVCFTAESSNFEVIIPFKSNYDYQTKIKNIKVEGYKTHIIRNDDYISINIDVKANENELTREGFNRTIVLSYTYDRGYDNDKELDHLDYYIGSPLRPFKLSSFEFNINLPRNTKSSIDNIYSLFTRENTIGAITEVTKLDSRITLSNDGTTIQGRINNGLSSYEGLLLKHDVYQEYFEKTRSVVNSENKLIVLYIIFFFVCFINFFLCGKDSTMIYTSDDSIPNHISPLISSLLLAKNLEEEKEFNEFEFKHLSSLIFKWANNGYLNIERIKVPLSLNDQINNSEMELKTLENINNISQADEDEKNKLYQSTSDKMSSKPSYKYELKFTKLKEVMRSEMPYFEKAIFDSLFVMTVNGSVDTSVIKNNIGPFRECILYFKSQLLQAKAAVLDYVESLKAAKNDKRAEMKKVDLKLLSFICWSIALLFEANIKYRCINNFVNPLVYLLILAIFYFLILQENNLINFIATILFTTLSYYMVDINLISFILLSLPSLMIITMRKYAFKYELDIEKIKGFKKFVKSNNRVKIVNALNDNPKYFYEALPHSIALGLNKKLIKKCEEFKIAMPGWLIVQPEEFNLALFNELIEEIDNTWNEIINTTF